MPHVSRKKEAFLYLARSAAESQTQYSDSLGFSFLKLLLYSHKKLFMHSEQG